MKNLQILLVICLLSIGFSLNAIAFKPIRDRPPTPRPEKPPIHAYLDGGLLTILGAAGVGYYLIRRKRKNKN